MTNATNPHPSDKLPDERNSLSGASPKRILEDLVMRARAEKWQSAGLAHIRQAETLLNAHYKTKYLGVIPEKKETRGVVRNQTYYQGYNGAISLITKRIKES